MNPDMKKDMESILLEEDELEQLVAQLGEKLTRDYENVDMPLFICVLKGAVMFMSDLIKQVRVPLEIDFMAVSSYGSGTESTGEVRILKDLNHSVKDRHVVVVEDIIDSGITLNYLMHLLKARGAASVEVVTLLSKPDRRRTDVPVKYLGREIPDAFVVGYGLDYAERYRNLPYIGILKPEVYEN